MKKKILILVMMLVMSMSYSYVLASEEEIIPYTINDNSITASDIQQMHSGLFDGTSDVITQGDALYNEYALIYNDATTDASTKSKSHSLMSTIIECKSAYENFVNQVNEMTDRILRLAGVYIIAAYFKMSNYELSAELLLHSIEAEANENYYPVKCGSLYHSNDYHTNFDSYSTEKDTTFETMISVYDRDSYYSIHDTEINNITKEFEDIYDFRNVEKPQNLVDYGVDFCHDLQESGILKVYNVRIPIENPHTTSYNINNNLHSTYCGLCYVSAICYSTNYSYELCNATNHYKVCNDCDSKILEEHFWRRGWAVVTPLIFTCIYCGATKFN